MAEGIAQLHPVAQVFAIIAIAAVAGIFIWQLWKKIREG
jgi:hypothetical protein